MQLPLGFLIPQNAWTLPTLGNLPSDWNAFSRIAIDVETRDDELKTLGCGARRGAYIIGFALCFDSRFTFYLPIRHENGQNLDILSVIRYIRDNGHNYRGTIVGANLSYDLDMLAEEGINFPNARWFRDVLIAEPLLDELQDNYSLESVGQRRLGIGKNEAQLNEGLSAFAPRKTPKTKLKSFMYLLPPELVGPYAEQDVKLPLRLLQSQEREIEDQDLDRVWDLESKLLPVLVKMRRRGVRIDQDKLDRIDNWARAEEAECWKRVHRETGVGIQVGQAMEAKVLAKVLNEIGVHYSMGGAKGTQPSIDKFLLESIQHPVGALIRRARQMSQLRTTFVNSIRSHMVNGRIHCTFNQMRKNKEGVDETEGAAFGRLSCSDPNLQQQPARDPELGPMWRSIYLPEEGMVWGSLDYSQQEPKWLIECSTRVPVGNPRGYGGKLGISESARNAALEAAERYRQNPGLDCYNDFTIAIFGEMTKEGRKKTKEIYLGRVYGMGGAKMARKMGLETATAKNKKGEVIEVAGPEAQTLINAFDAGVPYAREMAQMMTYIAEGRGYVRTHLGRRCRFPLKVSEESYTRGDYDYGHKGLNRIIQGSSADETKTAVVQLDEAGFFIQLQVHDEIDGSFKDVEEAEQAADVMRNAIPKSLPTKVDVECGSSWGDSM